MKSNIALSLLLAHSFFFITMPDAFADDNSNPCVGENSFISIVDRPTNAFSPCTIPFKQADIEMGYQYQQLTHANGYLQNYPAAELRIGLPIQTELDVLLPNYIHQSMTPHSASTATNVAIKHGFYYSQTWLATLMALVTLPDGSVAFGSQGTGVTINAIVSYTYNPQINLTLMIGGSSQTDPSQNGGQRFTTINPDLVFTYAFTDTFNLYAEVYGQSKTARHEGSGFNCDLGIIYLPLPHLEVDLSIGQRLSGDLQGFNHYIGTGFAILF